MPDNYVGWGFDLFRISDPEKSKARPETARAQKGSSVCTYPYSPLITFLTRSSRSRTYRSDLAVTVIRNHLTEMLRDPRFSDAGRNGFETRKA